MTPNRRIQNTSDDQWFKVTFFITEIKETNSQKIWKPINFNISSHAQERSKKESFNRYYVGKMILYHHCSV